MDPQEARNLVIAFASHRTDIPQLQFIRDHQENIKIREYGEGQINFVFGVKSQDEKQSVIMKHARDHAKFDKDEKMSLARQEIEFNALSLLDGISVGCVPKPYCLDTKFNIIVMENLEHMTLLGTQLKEQNIDQAAVAKFGKVLGMLHKKTLKVNNSPEEWEHIEKKFRNDELRDVIRGYMLERSLLEDDPINSIPTEGLEVYRKIVMDPEVQSLFKDLCVSHDDNDGCVILADCHVNGVFNKDGRCALFDMEFSYIGHPCANLAMTLAGMIVYPLSLENPDWNQHKTAVRNFIDAYFEETASSTGDMLHEKNLSSSLTAFTGAFMFEMPIFCQIDEMLKGITANAKIEMMKRGIRMVKQHKAIGDKEAFLKLFFMNSGDN